MAKARNLKDITLQEVSLVDKGANKKTFLFAKQKNKKIKVSIESDGTAKGTKVSMNGDDLGKLKGFNFSFYGNDFGKSENPVSCSYTKIVASEDGFSRTETFYLTKGEFKMDKEMLKLMKEYLGKDTKVDFEKLKEGDIESLQKALGTILEYKNDFPEDLAEAVGTIMVAGCTSTAHVEKKDDEDEDNEDNEDIKKSGAKFSKDVLAKLRGLVAAAKALEGILPQEKSDDGNDDVKKQVEDLAKQLESLTKKKDEKASDDEKSELTKMVEELATQIKAIAKSTGVKKGIEGQDNDNDDDGGSGNKKWKSFSA